MPRVAAVAARFRVVDSFEAFADHMAELLDRARGADVVVLPELVTAELLCIEPGWRDASMNDLPVIAKHEARLKDWFAAEASARGQHLLAGTTLVRRESGVYNEATLYRPDGRRVSHDKSHLFRAEGASGVIKTGTESTVVDTQHGRLGILICYEIEIPECVDAAVAQGADLLLNPSMTLSDAGAWRVLHCAHARAVENQVFVATAQISGGPVGFAPGFWGISRIIAPADHPWAATGTVAETEPLAEAAAVADLSYADLYENRETGAVSTFHDRLRNADLYRSWPSRV